MITVVVSGAGAGARALVRTADSAARQDVPVAIAIAVPAAAAARGVITSIQQRLGAAHADGPTASRAIATAVERSSGDLLFLPAPWRLAPTAVARCAAALEENPDAAVAVPELRIESADGRLVRTLSVEPSVAHLLAAPLSTPPVFLIRRQLWSAVGPPDEHAAAFAPCDWWLRVVTAAAAAGTGIVAVPEPLAIFTARDRDWWPPAPDEPLDLASFRAVLERHRDFLERHMVDLVVGREMALGRLMARHRDALRDRDAHLAELDRLRAEAAHHRAYLEHHGRAALEWGDLRRPDPISRDWGYDRGTPLDRRYIHDFVAAHSSDVSGSVLEVQEDDFTRELGGPRVTHSAVVDLDDGNTRATVVADLRAAAGIDGDQFNCIILTQTLHVIADMPAVLRECWRLLAPGGVLLATLPSASRVCLEYGSDGDLWRMTPAGAAALFEPVFGPSNVSVTPYGSVLTNVAFLHGLAAGELTDAELDAADPYHPVLAGVRAYKAPARRTPRRARHRGAVLLYHRVGEDEDVHDLALPSAVFAEQLAWLARECRVIPLDELLSSPPECLPDRAVAITFDDGYLDTLEQAAPRLERAGVPATVFATTRWLERTGEYWWDVLEDVLLRSEPPPSLTVDLGGARVTLPTRGSDDRRAAHDRLHGRLVHAAIGERDRIVSQIGAWGGRVAGGRRRPLVADELRRLAQVPGISIGAHGVDHLALPDQTPAEQRREIADSIAALERVLARRVDLFAFPYGAVDRASAAVARTRCRWSVSCRAAAVAASFDAAGVPRIEVNRRSIGELRDRLERAFA